MDAIAGMPDGQPLPGGAIAVLAPRPTAGPALAILQLLPCPANAALVCCLASSTQQMNSLRAKGVMSFQASSAVVLAINALRRSAGSGCTTPPGTRWLLTRQR